VLLVFNCPVLATLFDGVKAGDGPVLPKAQVGQVGFFLSEYCITLKLAPRPMTLFLFEGSRVAGSQVAPAVEIAYIPIMFSNSTALV